VGGDQSWLLPCGATAAVIVSAWLVEAKQSVIENMAPVLTRVFTPLFAATLLAFLIAVIWTQNGIDVERDVLGSPAIAPGPAACGDSRGAQAGPGPLIISR